MKVFSILLVSAAANFEFANQASDQDLYPFYDRDGIECGGNITQTQIISYPKIDQFYPANMTCVWKVQLDPSIKSFDLVASEFVVDEIWSNCTGDYFSIIDGFGSEVKYCGFDPPPGYFADDVLIPYSENIINTGLKNHTVKGNTATLSFKSDHRYHYGGFTIEVIAETTTSTTVSSSSTPLTTTVTPIVANLANASTALKCWTGIANSIDDFDANKVSIACQDNEETCQMVVRQRGGVVESVMGSCKAADACKKNRAQNFFGAHECKPEDTTDENGANITSVCRSCFDDQTKQLISSNYTTEAEWMSNLLD